MWVSKELVGLGGENERVLSLPYALKSLLLS